MTAMAVASATCADVELTFMRTTTEQQAEGRSARSESGHHNHHVHHRHQHHLLPSSSCNGHLRGAAIAMPMGASAHADVYETRVNGTPMGAPVWTEDGLSRVKLGHISSSGGPGGGNDEGVDVVDFLPAKLSGSSDLAFNSDSIRTADAIAATEVKKKAAAAAAMEDACGIAFVYGTLKRDFGNYWLIKELVEEGAAQFIGSARTKLQYPLVCGPFAVPFLLDIPSDGWCVKGELYKVNAKALMILDEKEGTTAGHYMRKPLVVTDIRYDESFIPSVNHDDWYFRRDVDLNAEAYFADDGIAFGLADASRCQYIDAFTKTEAANYIVRKDRPKNRTFLEHVRLWIQERTRETQRRNN